MTRVKIVRCYLRSPGEAPTVRFIPLREYDLWKYYMTHRHGKIVEHGQTSVWMDAESFGSASSREARPREAHPREAVVRIDLQYWSGQHQTPAFIERYFPLDEYMLIRDVFLGHFPDQLAPSTHPTLKRRVREVKGYFVYQHNAD